MTTPDSQPFDRPQFRQVLGIFLLAQFGGGFLLGIADSILKLDLITDPIAGPDPIIEPVFYLLAFGSCSFWIFWQYRQRDIDIAALIGPWALKSTLPAAIGLWITLFMFSYGAFWVSFVLLSLAFPEYVDGLLQQSIFLGAGDTRFPGLYNVLIGIVLVIGAPILEEFLFRGFLLHRWGTRWTLRVAVILSSCLFGFLHPNNPIGLTVFGLAMALLYLRSRSLGLVILVHSLNNAIAASLGIITRLLGETESLSLADFRTGIWWGLMFLLVSTPFLVRFVRQNWHITHKSLPYFAQGEE